MATPATKLVRVVQGTKHVKHILSANQSEAKGRARDLYKAWYRQMESIPILYEVPDFDVKIARQMLRSDFERHSKVKDTRIIDSLVLRGQSELVDTVNIWKQKNHIMYWYNKQQPKKTDFLSSFFEGK